jgi:hypothetical protein
MKGCSGLRTMPWGQSSTAAKQKVPGGKGRTEARMTKTELADTLHRLDPGATVTVPPVVLASVFGAGTLTKETVAVIEAFALDHRCTFSYGHEHDMPTFEKDDIF